MCFLALHWEVWELLGIVSVFSDLQALLTVVLLTPRRLAASLRL